MSGHRQPLVRLLAALMAQHGVVNPDELSAAVIDWLTSPEILNRLSDRIHNMYCAAADAHNLRDDLYENPRSSFAMAEIAIAAVHRELVEDGRGPLADNSSPSALAGLSYKDWTFHLVRFSDGQVGVRAVAKLPNSRGSGTFLISRTASAVDGIAPAAFRAVMQIEEHEAREAFQAQGKRPFDPHDSIHLDPTFLPTKLEGTGAPTEP